MRIVKYMLIAVVLIIFAVSGLVLIKAFNSLRWEHGILAEKINELGSSAQAISECLSNNSEQRTNYKLEYPWLDADAPVLIAHALGGIDGRMYTNSKEAMEQAYENGFRVFEADFQLVNGQLLMIHDFERAAQMCSFDSEEFDDEMFLSSRLYGEYTPMNWKMVLEFMQTHPDIYIITDTKSDKQPYMSRVLSELVIQTIDYDASLLNRVVLQIYNQHMFGAAMDIYPFKSVIYTLYKSEDTEEQARIFCAQNGIKAVALDRGRYPESFVSSLKENGISPLVHTVNDEQEAQCYVDMGCVAIYTDFLVPFAK